MDTHEHHHHHESHSGHHHDHGHAHQHSHGNVDAKLGLSIVLNGAIVIAEVIGGLVSGSLALLSDALHNLSDVVSLVLTYLTRKLAKKAPTKRYSYGFRRAEVLSALLNSATLLIALTLIAREAVLRLIHPEPILRDIVLIVGSIGLAGNLFSMLLLKGHAHGDLNLRSAFLHLLQDTLSSVIVLVAVFFSNTGWGIYLDPIASLVVALFVVRSGWQILKETIAILMEAVPKEIDLAELQHQIEHEFPIRGIHHIHVWEVGWNSRSLTAHILIENGQISQAEALFDQIRHFLHDRYGIDHSTLEAECAGCGCQNLLHST